MRRDGIKDRGAGALQWSMACVSHYPSLLFEGSLPCAWMKPPSHLKLPPWCAHVASDVTEGGAWSVSHLHTMATVVQVREEWEVWARNTCLSGRGLVPKEWHGTIMICR